MQGKRKPHRWAPSGRREYLAQLGYIREDSQATARLVRSRIQAAIREITANSGIGRPGLVAGTREFPVKKTRLILIYMEDEQNVYLLNCWHSSRER